MEVVLDVGAFGDGKTHLAENRHALLHRLAHRVDAPVRPRPHRQRDVDGLAGNTRFQGGGFEVELARGNRRRDGILDLVQRLPGGFARLAVELAKALHLLGNAALAAKRRYAHGIQRFKAVGCGHFSQQRRLELRYVGRRHRGIQMARRPRVRPTRSARPALDRPAP